MSTPSRAGTRVPSPPRAALGATALTLLCLLLLLAVVRAAPASPRAASWTQLASGSRGDYFWSVKVNLGEGPTEAGSLGAQRPCLLVGAGWRSGALEYHRSRYRECAAGASLSRTGPPLIAIGAQPSTGAPVRFSAVGMVFPPAARRVRITYGDGSSETVRLLRLPKSSRGRASGLGGLRYAAFATHGTWCAERLVSLGAGGKVLWDSGVDEYPCGTRGEPQFEA